MIDVLESRDYNVIQAAIQYGCDINTVDGAGRTPCINAVLSRNAHTLALFISSGADLSIRDNNRCTAYDYAVKSTIPQLISLFDIIEPK